MIEFLKHVIGACGDHFHPNIWNVGASLPIIGSAFYYIKCKCGNLLNHKSNCEYETLKRK